MAYKGSHYQVASGMHLVEKIKDILVSAGWTLVGPSTDPAAQDDADAYILGWFLHSTGEDGQKDLHAHVCLQDDSNWRLPGPVFSYLDTGVSDTDTDFILPTGDGSKWSNGDTFVVEGEVCLVGTVSGDTLTSCTRGVNGTTPAAHSANTVLAKLSSTDPCIHMYPYRDLANPIAQSSGTQSLNIGSTGGIVPGLDGYKASTFDYACLLKARTSGKMRWISADAGDGNFSYQDFLTAPGVDDVDIISGGFFPPLSRKQDISQSYSSRKDPLLRNYNSTELGDVWLYASKDGIAAVRLDGSSYTAHYWGAYVPLASPLTTTAEGQAGGGAAISPGDQTIKVGNTDLFVEGGVYRILSQDYRDWGDNVDQSGSTYMGATGSGEWPDLDGDEIAFECVVVDSIDSGAGTITFTHPLNYGYRSGAKIGEDPSPVMTVCDGGYSSNPSPFTPTGEQVAVAFHAVEKPLFLSTHPAHRIRWRCGFNNIPTEKPWEGDGNRDNFNQREQLRRYLLPGDSLMLDNEEFYGSRLPLVPFSIGYYDANDRSGDNGFNRIHGVIPFFRAMYSSLGAQSEDTLKVMWNGAHETFRIFYLTNPNFWVAVGPEIA